MISSSEAALVPSEMEQMNDVVGPFNSAGGLFCSTISVPDCYSQESTVWLRAGTMCHMKQLTKLEGLGLQGLVDPCQ